MIELKNVTKFYKTKNGKKYILKNVTMTIREGINVGILGRNGAGKSTLLRMLGGIDFPNSGKIISNKTFSWPMGFAGGFQGNMTGKQNVKFVSRLFSKSEKEIKKIIDFVKEFSELGDYFDMPINTYSSGMRSRLTFGLSLAFDFDYLLIDETLSVGDTRFKEKSKQALMEKIKKSNVLMVSHSMKDIVDICDSGIIVNEGKIYFYEDVEDAIKKYKELNFEEDYEKVFFTDRAFFFELFTEGYIFVFNNNLYVLFKGKNRDFLLKITDKFLENINPNTKLLFKKLKNGEKVEEQIVLAFINMLSNLQKVYYNCDDNFDGLIYNNKEYLFKLLNNRKNKFIKINKEGLKDIYEKINN